VFAIPSKQRAATLVSLTADAIKTPEAISRRDNRKAYPDSSINDHENVTLDVFPRNQEVQR
jgi:hypothetical protein